MPQLDPALMALLEAHSLTEGQPLTAEVINLLYRLRATTSALLAQILRLHCAPRSLASCAMADLVHIIQSMASFKEFAKGCEASDTVAMFVATIYQASVHEGGGAAKRKPAAAAVAEDLEGDDKYPPTADLDRLHRALHDVMHEHPEVSKCFTSADFASLHWSNDQATGLVYFICQLCPERTPLQCLGYHEAKSHSICKKCAKHSGGRSQTCNCASRTSHIYNIKRHFQSVHKIELRISRATASVGTPTQKAKKHRRSDSFSCSPEASASSSQSSLNCAASSLEQASGPSSSDASSDSSSSSSVSRSSSSFSPASTFEMAPSFFVQLPDPVTLPRPADR